MLELMQVQMVADKLAGVCDERVRAEDLDEPWRSVFRAVKPLDGDMDFAPRMLWWGLCEAGVEGEEKKNGMIERVVALLPDRPLPYKSLEEMARELEPVT